MAVKGYAEMTTDEQIEKTVARLAIYQRLATESIEKGDYATAKRMTNILEHDAATLSWLCDEKGTSRERK